MPKDENRKTRKKAAQRRVKRVKSDSAGEPAFWWQVGGPKGEPKRTHDDQKMAKKKGGETGEEKLNARRFDRDQRFFGHKTHCQGKEKVSRVKGGRKKLVSTDQQRRST